MYRNTPWDQNVTHRNTPKQIPTQTYLHTYSCKQKTPQRDRNTPHNIQITLLIIPQSPNRRLILFIASLNIIHTLFTNNKLSHTCTLTTHALYVVIPLTKVAGSCRKIWCNKFLWLENSIELIRKTTPS